MILTTVSIILFLIILVVGLVYKYQTRKKKEYFEDSTQCIGNALSGDKKVHLTNSMIDTYYTKSQLGNVTAYNSNRTLEALKKFKMNFEVAKQQQEQRRNLFTSMTKTNSTYVSDQVNTQNSGERDIEKLKQDADARIKQIDADVSTYVNTQTTSEIPDKIQNALKSETTRQLSLLEPPKPLDFSQSITDKITDYEWTYGDNNTIIRIEPLTRKVQCVASASNDVCATDKTIDEIKHMDIPVLSCDDENYNNVNHWCYKSYKNLANKYDNSIDYTNCPVDWELNNAKQCVPKTGIPLPQPIMVAENQSSYVLSYNGNFYRALNDNWPYNDSKMVCQNEFLYAPNGWTIAPNTEDSKYVISNYKWSTAVMVVSDGTSYWTNLWNDRQIRSYGTGMLNTSYGQYKPNVCNGGILLIKIMQPPISSISWKDTIDNKRKYTKEYSNIRFPFKTNVTKDISSVINTVLDAKLGTITSKKTLNVNLDKFTFYRNGILVRTFAYTPSNGRGSKISEEITTSSINYSWNQTIDKIFNIPRTQNIFIEFVGYIFIPEDTTSLKFHITANTAVRFSLALDGKIDNIRQLNDFLADFTTDTITVQEKQYLPFIIEYYQIGGTSNPGIRLEWTLNNSSTSEIVPRAVYYLDKNQCGNNKTTIPEFSHAIGKQELSEMSGLPAGIVGWYDGGSFNKQTNKWLDKSGNSNHITDCFGEINVLVNGGTEIKYLTGNTTSGMTLTSPAVWNGGRYTFFHITRYAGNGNNNNRIWSGTTGTWFSGHWSNRGAAIYHDGWMSGGGRWSYEGMLTGKEWALITDQTTYSRINRAGYQFWGGSGVVPQNISINKSAAAGEVSDWACAEVIIYQRELSVAEIEVVEAFLYTKNKLSV